MTLTAFDWPGKPAAAAAAAAAAEPDEAGEDKRKSSGSINSLKRLWEKDGHAPNATTPTASSTTSA